MYTYTITHNADADPRYFDWWLKQTYPTNYDGYSNDSAVYIAVHFLEEPTPAEKSAIATFYGNLTTAEVIENKHCVIYDYIAPWVQTDTDKTMPPCHINYVTDLTKRLHPIVTEVYKGEVRQITYYADASFDAYGQVVGSNPVVREDIAYVRDVAKLALSRTMQIWWYLKDGSVYTTAKQRVKYYAPQERIAEGQRLRQNIIDFMQSPVIAMLMQTEQVEYNEAITIGAQFFLKYSADISSWVQASRENPLPTKVIGDTEVFWLDNVIDGNGTTIRDYMLDQLNY